MLEADPIRVIWGAHGDTRLPKCVMFEEVRGDVGCVGVQGK